MIGLVIIGVVTVASCLLIMGILAHNPKEPCGYCEYQLPKVCIARRGWLYCSIDCAIYHAIEREEEGTRATIVAECETIKLGDD